MTAALVVIPVSSHGTWWSALIAWSVLIIPMLACWIYAIFQGRKR